MLFHRILFATVRPSGLRIRLPKYGLYDDSRNVDKALRSIRKEMEDETIPKKYPRQRTTVNTQGNTTMDTTPMETQSSLIHVDLQQPVIGKRRVDVRNRCHRDIWISLKRRDSLSFERQCKLLRTAGVELDGVSYTLMINGTLIFNKTNDIREPLAMIDEMKEVGIHPALIRLLARLIVMYFEMWSLNSRPVISNWLSITRSSWLTAVFVTRRINKCDDSIYEDGKLMSQTMGLER